MPPRACYYGQQQQQKKGKKKNRKLLAPLQVAIMINKSLFTLQVIIKEKKVGSLKLVVSSLLLIYKQQ
jgi:hypothetical protein